MSTITSPSVGRWAFATTDSSSATADSSFGELGELGCLIVCHSLFAIRHSR